MSFLIGFGHLYGYPVGILGNNGVLFSECALKVRNRFFMLILFVCFCVYLILCLKIYKMKRRR